MDVHRNHAYRDALFAEDGSILWFDPDPDKVSWIWQAQDDPGATKEELTVAQAIEHDPEASSWVLQQTFEALIGFNVEESLSKMKLKAEEADGDLALSDEEWKQAFDDFTRGALSFQKIAEQLIAAARPLP